MYIKIEENILKEWADWEFDGSTFVNVDCSTFESEKYEVQNGELVNISLTEEYLAKKQEEFRQSRIMDLKTEIAELDKKRIRAICEPEIKDEASGQTWLDYYNEQILAKRTELEGL